MHETKSRMLLFFAVAYVFGACSLSYSAEISGFAVIQPGQPGSSQEAQPVMDSLAAYLSKKLDDGVALQGAYFNDSKQALGFVRGNPPKWGIVSIEFFTAHAEDLRMTPIASTRPGGAEKDVWRIVVPKDGPADWRKLAGNLAGTMFFEERAASRLLLGEDLKGLPFTLSAISSPLRVLRSLSGEKKDGAKASGIALDRKQYDAMKSLPLAAELKVIFTSQELPTSPVVWFGPPGEEAKRIALMLNKMDSDPEAADLLTLLQTAGFGPVDPDLSRLRM